jgi:pimeloyl-ACP methyl ester carboxylesterase
MILVYAVAILAVLALITQVGVLVLQRIHPQQGETIAVAGAQLNVVDLGPRDAAGPPIVMTHGSSANLESVRQPVGDLLAQNHRVILIDRPGHGWSRRDNLENSSPAMQAKMIDEALEKLGVSGAILVVHSLAGGVGARMALDYPQRVAGLVMLAPAAYPWIGGDGWLNTAITAPVIGPLLAYTVVLPFGLVIVESATREVFLPQVVPSGFVGKTATRLLMRPREFLANTWDRVTLKAALAEQAPRYGNIKMPVVVITDEIDFVASPKVHSFPFAAAVPNAKLVVLPGVGHVVQVAAPERVIGEIETMIAGLTRPSKAAMR